MNNCENYSIEKNDFLNKRFIYKLDFLKSKMKLLKSKLFTKMCIMLHDLSKTFGKRPFSLEIGTWRIVGKHVRKIITHVYEIFSHKHNWSNWLHHCWKAYVTLSCVKFYQYLANTRFDHQKLCKNLWSYVIIRRKWIFSSQSFV